MSCLENENKTIMITFIEMAYVITVQMSFKTVAVA